MARLSVINPRNWRTVQQPWGDARSRIYVVQEGEKGPFKIGIAGHPRRRLEALQCGNPRLLRLRLVFEGDIDSCVDVEKAAHAFFARKRVLGEWFKCSIEEISLFLHEYTET